MAAWYWPLALAFAMSALLALAAWWPLRLDVSGRARGMSDGSWVLAGGASLSFVSVAFVMARGAEPEFTLVAFGRRSRWKPGKRKKRKAPGEREPSAVRERRHGAARNLQSEADLGWVAHLMEQRKHFRLRYLVLELDYGFQDPLITGRLAAALAALTGALPSRVRLQQRPRWNFEDGWEAKLDGRAIVRPLLAALHFGAYVLRRRAPSTRGLHEQ